MLREPSPHKQPESAATAGLHCIFYPYPPPAIIEEFLTVRRMAEINDGVLNSFLCNEKAGAFSFFKTENSFVSVFEQFNTVVLIQQLYQVVCIIKILLNSANLLTGLLKSPNTALCLAELILVCFLLLLWMSSMASLLAFLTLYGFQVEISTPHPLPSAPPKFICFTTIGIVISLSN